ncbi:MAG: hypothetical protein AAF432_00980 [Planctomycetota bacterium]
MQRRLLLFLGLLPLALALTGCGAIEAYAGTAEDEDVPSVDDLLNEHQEAIDIVNAICDPSPAVIPSLDGLAGNRASLREFLKTQRVEHGQLMLGVRIDLLQTRAQIELFKLANQGQAPSFDSYPWEVVREGFIDSVPTNPLSPTTVARRAVVLESPGLDGSDIDPRRAGWVWNSTDEQLYLAGMTENELREVCHGALHSANVDELEPILVSKLQMIRAQLELYQVAHGNKPNLLTEGWSPLTERRLIGEVPLNPLSPYSAASRVVAGTSAMAIDPANAGWVWDEGKQMLYAAGYDDTRRLFD